MNTYQVELEQVCSVTYEIHSELTEAEIEEAFKNGDIDLDPDCAGPISEGVNEQQIVYIRKV